jgi:hypothetical protein
MIWGWVGLILLLEEQITTLTIANMSSWNGGVARARQLSYFQYTCIMMLKHCAHASSRYTRECLVHDQAASTMGCGNVVNETKQTTLFKDAIVYSSHMTANDSCQ